MDRQAGEKATLKAIKKAGHLVNLERPCIYNRELKRILASANNANCGVDPRISFAHFRLRFWVFFYDNCGVWINLNKWHSLSERALSSEDKGVTGQP